MHHAPYVVLLYQDCTALSILMCRYAGRGTFVYYEILSQQLGSSFRAAAEQCLQQHPNLTTPTAPAASKVQGGGEVLPLLCCQQPPSYCTLCRAPEATANRPSTAGGQEGQERPMHPQLEACFEQLAKLLAEKVRKFGIWGGFFMIVLSLRGSPPYGLRCAHVNSLCN